MQVLNNIWCFKIGEKEQQTVKIWRKCYKTTSQQRKKERNNMKHFMGVLATHQYALVKLWFGIVSEKSMPFLTWSTSFSEILVTLRQQYFSLVPNISEKSIKWNLLKLYKILCCDFNGTVHKESSINPKQINHLSWNFMRNVLFF